MIHEQRQCSDGKTTGRDLTTGVVLAGRPGQIGARIRGSFRWPLAARAVFIACGAFVTGLTAAPLQRSLGQGLFYFRLQTVPADIPNDEAVQNRPVVLDLRYAKSDAGGARVLDGWLKFHASARTPFFVLLNASTSPALVGMLRDHDPIPDLLTISGAGSKLATDVSVTTTSQEEKQAYEALEAGTSVPALTTDNPDKQRNDEASLARDRAPEPLADSDDTVEPDAPVKPKPLPLVDRALQRAIQLYRGLKAMKAVAPPAAK